MGQPLPLPERIPMPNDNLLEEMNSLGFTVNNNGKPYVTYTMPTTWHLHNHSWRQDLPEYYFVDENNMARFCISGSWKETYDNELSITMVKEPFEYKPRTEKVIPNNETSTSAIIGKFVEVMDSANTEI